MNTELTKGFVDFIDDNRLQSLIHDTKEYQGRPCSLSGNP